MCQGNGGGRNGVDGGGCGGRTRSYVAIVIEKSNKENIDASDSSPYHLRLNPFPVDSIRDVSKYSFI